MRGRSTTAVLAVVAVAAVGGIAIAVGAGGDSDAPSPVLSNDDLLRARSGVEHAAARRLGSDFACVAVDGQRMKLFVTSAAAREAAVEFKDGLRFASQVDVKTASARFRYSTMIEIEEAVKESRPRLARNASLVIGIPTSRSSRCPAVRVEFHGGGRRRKRWQREMLRRYGADRVRFVQGELVVLAG